MNRASPAKNDAKQRLRVERATGQETQPSHLDVHFLCRSDERQRAPQPDQAPLRRISRTPDIPDVALGAVGITADGSTQRRYRGIATRNPPTRREYPQNRAQSSENPNESAEMRLAAHPLRDHNAGLDRYCVD